MKEPGKPANEKDRLRELKELNILDTLPDDQFDEITKIASIICHTPISLISLTDKDRQWFKSKQGLDICETPRELAFCAHAILNPNEITIVPDARLDERFADNPLVKDPPNLIFYAGAPLLTKEGNALGTLCVIDHEPRKLSKKQIEALRGLANQVVYIFEARRKNELLNHATRDLQNTNELLSQFAHTASHDLKAPLRNINQIVNILQKQYHEIIDEEGRKLLNMLNERVENMDSLITGILNYSKSSSFLKQNKERFALGNLIEDILELTNIPEDFNIIYDKDLPTIKTHKIALEQILLNLINNAIKYNDKEKGLIEISFKEKKFFYVIAVKDNGPGIPKSHHNEIFEPFKTLGVKDRNNTPGTGMGLALVKKLVELMGGRIKVNSEPGKGSEFNISIKK